MTEYNEIVNRKMNTYPRKVIYMQHDLFIRAVHKSKDYVVYQLRADTSQRSCGESRSDSALLRDGMDLKDATNIVSQGLARWESGPPTCPTCGHVLEK